MLERLKMGLVDLALRLLLLFILIRFGLPWFQAELTKSFTQSIKAITQTAVTTSAQPAKATAKKDAAKSVPATAPSRPAKQ